jgi:hypothetical protein
MYKTKVSVLRGTVVKAVTMLKIIGVTDLNMIC